MLPRHFPGIDIGHLGTTNFLAWIPAGANSKYSLVCMQKVRWIMAYRNDVLKFKGSLKRLNAHAFDP